MDIENTAAGNTYKIIQAIDTEEGASVQVSINNAFLVSIRRTGDIWLIDIYDDKPIIGDDMDEVIDEYIAGVDED